MRGRWREAAVAAAIVTAGACLVLAAIALMAWVRFGESVQVVR